jgi:hypothetical protein
MQKQIQFESKEFIGRKNGMIFIHQCGNLEGMLIHRIAKENSNFNFNSVRNCFQNIQIVVMARVITNEETIGAQSNKHHSLEIGSHEYRHHKFILGTDTERVLEAGFTGMNTRAGDILNVRFEHNTTNNEYWAHAMHVILHSDNIMEVRDSGITIFD